MQKSLEVGFAIGCDPVFPAIPVFCEFLGKHAGLIRDQVVLEEFGVGYFSLYVLNEVRGAVLLVALPGHFDQTAAVMKGFPIHGMEHSLAYSLT